MIVIKTAIPDVLILEPKVFGDERGFFFESYNQQTFEESIGRKVTFVQDNHSKSKKNVLRGLHFQRGENAQGKLVRCAVGEVFDVAVDIRKESPTFGQWVGVNLSAENKRQLWIQKVLLMVLLLLVIMQNFCTKQLIITHLHQKVAFYGMMRQ